MKRIISAFLVTVFSIAAFMGVVVPARASALGGGSCNAPDFLGFKPWYADLCNGSEIDQPENRDETIEFVWTVVLNVLFDLFLAVGYLTLGFIIYGGFLYITAQGDPGKALKGQKTLTAAVIGVIITMVATVVVNTLKTVLGIAGNNWDQQFAQANVQNAFNWVYTVAGIVAVVFMIKAGIEYIISRGDPSKTQKAMRSIIYAAAGLVIVLLAAMITNFIVRATTDSLNSATSHQQILIEEEYEKVLG